MKFFSVIFFALPFCACSWVHEKSVIPLFLYAVASIITFIFYFIDKRAARANEKLDELETPHVDEYSEENFGGVDAGEGAEVATEEPKRKSRIPEKVLHLWELLFGFPGAILGQIALRHKSAKTSYQVVFWLIVIIHTAVWVWIFSLPEGTVIDWLNNNLHIPLDSSGGILSSHVFD